MAGRAEAVPQIRQDLAVAGMVQALVSESELPPGGMADMRVLPHLMSLHEINDYFPMVKRDEGENQWANELEHGSTRPSEELADPGLRGDLDLFDDRQEHLQQYT